MPYLGDGTWVQDAGLARDIVRGRTNYRPHSGDLTTATPRGERTMDRNVQLVGQEQLDYLMRRFGYSRDKALSVMRKHNQDMSFLKENTNGESDVAATAGAKEEEGRRDQDTE